MGIKIASNFDVETSLPIDSRFVVDDITARNAISDYKRFDGLFTFVKSENLTYQLHDGTTNSDWTVFDVQGDTGVAGIQGVTGVAGTQGDQGETGVAGIQGVTGAAGSQGDQGVTGAAGSQGDQGVTGAAGSQGTQGETGVAGIQGETGVAGIQGDQGVTGAAGSGDQGETGVAGIQGDQGITGAAGSQGTQGETGVAGIQGDQGVTGVGIQYWDRNAGSGYLYPSTISDKVGINETAPQEKLEVNGAILVKDKIKFTQDDGNEYIDSLADGYLDFGATTLHRFNAGIGLTKSQAAETKIEITNTNASGSCTFELDGVGNSAFFSNDNAGNNTQLAFAHNELRIRDRGTDPYMKITHDGTGSYQINTAGTGAHNLILGADGTDIVTVSDDDVYSIAWTDWSASASAFGWAATPTVEIYYKKIGKLVFVRFYITGTSNGTGAQFELPYVSASGQTRFCCCGLDSGSNITGGASGVINFNSSSRAELQPDQGVSLNLGGWTSSNTKAIRGEFFYEAV